jgi:serine/threonine-protein kinase RsbW
MQNRFELDIESKLENLPIMLDFVCNALAQFGTDPATTYKVQLAVDEACTNVIKHAYRGGVGPLKLVLEMKGNDLIIVLNDNGEPFNPASIAPPDLNSNLEARRIGGLGIYFIKKIMDEVGHSFDPQRGNTLTMKKNLPELGGNK